MHIGSIHRDCKRSLALYKGSAFSTGSTDSHTPCASSQTSFLSYTNYAVLCCNTAEDNV